MTNPSSDDMCARGETPPTTVQTPHGAAIVPTWPQIVADWHDAVRTLAGLPPAGQGQVTPDPGCDQPAKGRHVCARPIPTHQIHVCACGQTWNRDGLTYWEFLALRHIAGADRG